MDARALSQRSFVLTNLLLRKLGGAALPGLPGARLGGAAPGAAPPALWFEFDAGGLNLGLGLGRGCCAGLVGRFAPPGDLPALPGPVRSLVLQAALDDWMGRFEAAFGTPLTLRAVRSRGAHDPAGCVLELSVHGPGRPAQRLDIALDDDLADGLHARLEALPDGGRCAEGWRSLAFVLRFELGGCRLGPGELADLAPGDLLLFEHCHYQDGQTVRVRVGPCHYLEGGLQGARLTLYDTELKAMNDEEYPPGRDTAAGFDELEVTVGFDLGSRTMPFRELALLQPGHIFELDRNPDHPVAIRCNGALVGHGELVRINGERLGVRIVALRRKGEDGGAALSRELHFAHAQA